jgi:hypothetical protein
VMPLEATATIALVEPPVPSATAPPSESPTAAPTAEPTAAPAATNTQPPPVVDFSGDWLTNFARIRFNPHEGSQVSGQYSWYGSDGLIDIRGEVEGSSLRGTVGSLGVEFIFTLAADGQSFDGRWSGPQGSFHWCGVRAGALPDGCGFGGHWNTISEQTPPEQPTAELEQIGDRLRGSFFNGSSHGTLEGTIGAAGSGTHYTVVGMYTVNGYTDRFRWTLKDFNSLQFQGMWENNEGQHAWCGWRDSSSRPDPCFKGE